MWFTSATAPGKPIGMAMASAGLNRSLKSWPMAETTALGEGGWEGRLPEVWKARGEHTGGDAIQVRWEITPPREESDKCGGRGE